MLASRLRPGIGRCEDLRSLRGGISASFARRRCDRAELAAFQLTAPGQTTFINDVVLTRRFAYWVARVR